MKLPYKTWKPGKTLTPQEMQQLWDCARETDIQCDQLLSKSIKAEDSVRWLWIFLNIAYVAVLIDIVLR